MLPSVVDGDVDVDVDVGVVDVDVGGAGVGDKLTSMLKISATHSTPMHKLLLLLSLSCNALRRATMVSWKLAASTLTTTCVTSPSSFV